MTNLNNVQLNTTAAMPPAVELPAEEILNFLISNGSIDLDGVTTQMKQSRRQQILENHPYNIYQDKDGRWRTYIKDETNKYGRKAIVKSNREDLEDALCDFYLGVKTTRLKKRTTMASLYKEWLEFKALHVKASSVARVQNDWDRYYANTAIVNKPISSLTKLELDRWVHEMIREHEMTKHKYTNFSLIIRQELDYAVDLGVIDKNPFRDVRVDKKRVLVPEHKKPDRTQVFTREEQRKLEELAWKDFETKHYNVHQLTPLAVMFMFYTGARVGEICGIRYSDIEGNNLTIRRTVHHPDNVVTEDTKGTFGDREIPLVPKAWNLINAARQCQQEHGAPDDGYIFSMNEGPVLYTSVTKAFYRYCDILGIDAKSSHKARKTFVSTMLDGGVSINTVRKIVGHTDERTTLNNYCYDRSTDEEKVRKMAAALG